MAVGFLLLLASYYISQPKREIEYSIGSGNQVNDGEVYAGIGLGFPFVEVYQNRGSVVKITSRQGTVYASEVFYTPNGEFLDSYEYYDEESGILFSDALLNTATNSENAKHWYIKTKVELGRVVYTFYQPLEIIQGEILLPKYHATLNEPPFTAEDPVFLDSFFLDSFSNFPYETLATIKTARVTRSLVYSDTDVGVTQEISYGLAPNAHSFLSRMPKRLQAAGLSHLRQLSATQVQPSVPHSG